MTPARRDICRAPRKAKDNFFPLVIPRPSFGRGICISLIVEETTDSSAALGMTINRLIALHQSASIRVNPRLIFLCHLQNAGTTSLPLINADQLRQKEGTEGSVLIRVHPRKSAVSFSLPFAICHLPSPAALS
jgi:hypothetical protein